LHPENPELTRRKIAIFWLPLFSTWLMMGAEGPFIAAIIARLAAAKFNLAAFGVAFSLGMFFESPIIMMLSAANVLVKGRSTYLKLRRFNNLLNFLITLAMLLVLVPPVFYWLTEGLIGMPPAVARLTRQATLFLLPWPAAIGFRRFYQGILIGNRLPRRVAYGTVVRLVSMAATALFLYLFSSLPGACVGTAALSAGVVMEALASRIMAGPLVKRLLTVAEPGMARLFSNRELAAFYFHLALTSLLGLAVHPMMSFFMGKSRLPIESLAVLPVVQSLVFLFRSGGVAFQEVGVALIGRGLEHQRDIGLACRRLAAGASIALAVVLFTPLADAWLRQLSGLPRELAEFALLPARLLVLLPALEYWLSYQRSRFILTGQTRAVTFATAIEVSGIGLVLFACIGWLGMSGVVAGSVAQVAGRIASNLFLLAVSRTTPRDGVGTI